MNMQTTTPSIAPTRSSVQRTAANERRRRSSRRGRTLGRRRVDLPAPRTPGRYVFVRRTLDVAVSGALLLALLPLFALIALAIVVEDRGPVLYAQDRLGRDGRYFRFLKFRSMRSDADRLREQVVTETGASGGVRFKDRHDPRITRVGRVLRRFSLDELPQLVHVLRGDMALVGPRPPIPEEVARYDANEWQRLAVTPGLTCLWQTSGRSELSFERQVELDLDYIERRSLSFDLRLLWRTIPAVVGGRGAW